jgi:hypothetical protein
MTLVHWRGGVRGGVAFRYRLSSARFAKGPLGKSAAPRVNGDSSGRHTHPRRMTRSIVLIAACGLLGSCFPRLSPSEMTPPARSAFPNRELAFRVRGTPGQIRDTVLQSLNSLRLQYKQEVSDPFTYVVTVYTAEGPVPNARRVRRASYLIRLAPDPQSAECSWVALNWLVESRGIREETWSTQADDDAYIPRLREFFVRQFEEVPCR